MTYVAKNDWLYDSTEFDWAPELRYDTVETSSAIHFDVIADITATNSEAIKQLNPALLRSATPPVNYSLRLPEGMGELFEREIALIPADKRLAWTRYEVKDGDSLPVIAKRFKVKEAQVAELNSLTASVLPAGLRLTIPTAQKRVKSYYSGGAGGFVEGGTGRYRIARGDTLGGIARRFRVTVSQLRQWNGLPNTRIRAGRYLIINPDGKTTSARRASSGSKIGGAGKYKIRRGDSLSIIARRFGTSVTLLKAWNGLTSNRLQIGRYLVVRPPGSQTRRTQVAGSSGAPRRNRRASEPIPSGGRYRIRQGDNLSEIADRFGTTVSELRRMNGLRSSRIRAGKYLTVGPAPASASGSALNRTVAAAASSPAASAGNRYRIRRGDTLELIAKRHGTTISDLKARNGLRNSRIVAGDYLNVSSGGSVPRRNAPAPPSASSRASAKPRLPAARRPAPQQDSTRYKIRRGDTLAVIARRLGVTVADLKAWNGLRSSRIRAGSYLVVHGSHGNGSGAGPSQYLVRNGDTLGAIASRFGVTVKQLQAWNGLRGTRITAGKYLIVKPTGRASAGSKVASAAAGL